MDVCISYMYECVFVLMSWSNVFNNPYMYLNTFDLCDVVIIYKDWFYLLPLANDVLLSIIIFLSSMQAEKAHEVLKMKTGNLKQ